MRPNTSPPLQIRGPLRTSPTLQIHRPRKPRHRTPPASKIRRSCNGMVLCAAHVRMQKDFDGWNKIKKEVNAYELRRDFFYHQREVWWCAIGVNVDVETDGKQVNFDRPVLAFQKFNKEMFWGVPLTSRERTGEFYEKITHEKGAVWAMLTQMKTFSSKRLLRKVGMIPEKRLCENPEKTIRILTTNRAPPPGRGSRRPKPLTSKGVPPALPGWKSNAESTLHWPTFIAFLLMPCSPTWLASIYWSKVETASCAA